MYLLVQTTTGDVPWKELAGGGAALLVAGILFYVLRLSAAQHKDCLLSNEKIVDKFALAVEKTNETFGSTVREQQIAFATAAHSLMEDARAAHERREERLHDLVRELRGDPHPTTTKGRASHDS
jgi:hypothetical protein